MNDLGMSALTGVDRIVSRLGPVRSIVDAVAKRVLPREEAMAGSCPPSGAATCWTECYLDAFCFGMTILTPKRKNTYYDPTGPYCAPVAVCMNGCYAFC